jgi:ubiquinone/menaquinone biosynthesis C-methylase UbiE
MNNNVSDFSYWESRGETYKDLDDVRSKRTAYKIVNMIKTIGINQGSWILDAGCGTGDITAAIRDNLRHSNVVGVDLSRKMIKAAKSKERLGLRFFCSDLFRFLSGIDSLFDLVTMNLVAHHLIDGRDRLAVSEIYKALKDNGHILITEAVPPDDNLFDYYKLIFGIKEKRNYYLLKDLLKLVREAGFVNTYYETYKFDIRLLTWLNDKTLTEEKKKLLYLMHTEAPKEFKKAYAMDPLPNGDYRLRCKMCIVVGKKS